jgi:cytochrome c oxidase subunit 3
MAVSELATSADWEPGRSTFAAARNTGPFGVAVFLASDIMLFAAFFAAYFLLRSTNESWPPPTVDLDVPRAALATAVLITSSFTLIAGERAEQRAGRAALRRWLLITIALGALFLANQIAEYATLDFDAAAHAYGSAYWLLTGLHGAHVAAGLCALALLFVRSARSRDAVSFASWEQGVSLFWHLVDVIWVFVFLTIWVLQ